MIAFAARIAGVGTACATWFVAATCGWLLLMGLDAAWGGAWPTLRAVVYTSRFAFVYTVVASAFVGFGHLCRQQLEKRSVQGARVAMPVLVGLVVAMPAWAQADFLCSGEWISKHPQVGVIRVSIFAVLVASCVGLWLWHTRVILTHATSAIRRLAWWGGGSAAGAVLLYALRFRLGTYQSFAAFLLPALWLVCASLAFSVLQNRSGKLIGGLSVAVGILVVTSLVATNGQREARSVIYTHYVVAALTENAVRTVKASDIRFEIAGLERSVCLPPGTGRTATPHTATEDQRRNVILISVDALRQDALDWDDGGKPLMPALREFRSKSRNFARAVTSYPATLLAVGAAMTGREPHILAGAAQAPESIFRKTRAVVDSQFAVLPKESWFRGPVMQTLVLQGTEASYVPHTENATDRFVAHLEKSRAGGESTMAWIHYFEPHQPYESREGFAKGDGKRSRYKSELAYVDSELGRLFAVLESGGWFDDSLVVIFSDHGESLGERGYYGHHVYLNAWIADIPLLVRAPGLEAATVEAPVSSVSIAATVADFLRLAGGDLGTHASLLGAAHAAYSVSQAFPIRSEDHFQSAKGETLTEDALQHRLRTLQNGSDTYEPRVAISTEHHRLILRRNSDILELYNRRTDPDESHNALFLASATAEALTSELIRWHKRESVKLYCGLGEL